MSTEALWELIAVQTRASSVWDPMPRARMTVAEAETAVAFGEIERRVRKDGAILKMEIRDCTNRTRGLS